NKGIGYAVVRHLALNYASSSSYQPLTLLLTARNPTLGQNSTNKLREELKPNILVDDGGKVDLKFLKLDITDEQSIKEAKEVIEKDYGGLDVLINNAGIAFKGDIFDINVVRTTLGTNFYGTLNVFNTLYPLIRPNGRIINVSSTAGKPSFLSSALRQEFSKENLDMEGLIKLMKRFENAVETDIHLQDGWPIQAYVVSKIGVSKMTQILARRADKEGNNVKIFACCPGWVKTDMAGDAAKLTPDQGAETPVFLALDETVVPKSPTGTFWYRKKIFEWSKL
ncbi:11064_t:CDS:2, partial [Racocetra persica]